MKPTPYRFPDGHPSLHPETPEPPAKGTPRPAARGLVHAGLFFAFATVGGTLLIWPQWLAADGSRAALRIQAEREEELSGRLDGLRAMNDRLRAWDQRGRRVFQMDEIRAYPRLVKALATRHGAEAGKVLVTGRPSPRWRGVTVQVNSPDGEMSAGEIQPREVRLVLKGTFDGVYRTVAALCQQNQLFIPDRWSMVPSAAPAGAAVRGESVRADIVGTVFVAHEPDGGQKEPAVSSGARVAMSDGTPVLDAASFGPSGSEEIR